MDPDLVFPFERVVAALSNSTLLADVSEDVAYRMAGLEATVHSYLRILREPSPSDETLEGRVRTMETYITNSLEGLGDPKYMRTAERVARENIAKFGGSASPSALIFGAYSKLQ